MNAPVQLNERDLAFLGSALDGDILPVTYYPGSIIFREGDPGDCAYLIERGEVRLTKTVDGEERLLTTLGAGELLGELAAIDHQHRTTSATVVEETEVIVVSRQHLEQTIREADPILDLMLRALLSRMRSTHEPRGDAGPRAPVAGTDDSHDEAYRSARERVVGQMKLERALKEAIRLREFELYYQPIVRVATGEVAGFEALIRWLRPDRGLVPPIEFIGLAEQSGLIVPMGQWVLEEACHALMRLQSLGARRRGDEPPELFMSVNVSPRQIRHATNVENLVSTIHNVGVDPRCVKLEVTEQLLVDNPEEAGAAFNRFREIGAQLAIDDFGTGYSSLSYLHRYPLDVLKIDRSFVDAMVTDDASLRIVRTISRLAQEMNMSIVAEGVETVEHVDALQALDCDYAQGYLFSKPVPFAQAAELARRRRLLDRGEPPLARIA